MQSQQRLGPRFSDLRNPTRFTFVRHGESVANSQRVIQGHANSQLSESGREHARAAAAWLAEQKVDIVFSSPLDRSRETAEIIAGGIRVPDPTVMDDLKELDTGSFSGLSLSQASTDDPDLYSRFRIHSWDAVPGAESRASLLNRARTVWDTLIDCANDGRRHIVCVSHGGMLQWLIKSTFPSPDHRWMPVFRMANCGISVLTAESTSADHDGDLPDGTGFVAYWDLINYVPY